MVLSHYKTFCRSDLCIYRSIYLSVYLASIYLSIRPTVYLPTYLTTCHHHHHPSLSGLFSVSLFHNKMD